MWALFTEIFWEDATSSYVDSDNKQQARGAAESFVTQSSLHLAAVVSKVVCFAEMYVGDDVSPDFYGWVFPKYDHVAVGTGTVVNKTAIKQYQQATRDRSEQKTREGKIIRVEAHPIPEHPRAKRVEVPLFSVQFSLVSDDKQRTALIVG